MPFYRMHSNIKFSIAKMEDRSIYKSSYKNKKISHAAFYSLFEPTKHIPLSLTLNMLGRQTNCALRLSQGITNVTQGHWSRIRTIHHYFLFN
ncbi:hypothetical protein FKM82_019397 [Ascaphus truei]